MEFDQKGIRFGKKSYWISLVENYRNRIVGMEYKEFKRERIL